MKTIDDLKKDLVHGDYKIIQKMTRVSHHTILSIFTGRRQSNTPAGEKVRRAAEKLIDSRNALLDDAAEEQPELPFAQEPVIAS